MRLIHSTTRLLKEFFNNIPKYVVLSHTWGEQELSFQDFERGQVKPEATSKAGYAKIEHCCLQAERDGFEFIWVDTCCIDKTSSTELSEAINSMYRWYKEAEVCYAYLEDVWHKEDPQLWCSSFGKSRWFSRGWTLHELIAPSSVEFYGKDWHEIGTKLSLQTKVSEITGIPVHALKFGDMEYFSVA
jgi:hypothetical protein